MKTLEELSKTEFDLVKNTHAKLSPSRRDSLKSIENGFGKMTSNMYWAENIFLELLGVVKIKQSRFRFHDVEITELGKYVIEYHDFISSS